MTPPPPSDARDDDVAVRDAPTPATGVKRSGGVDPLATPARGVPTVSRTVATPRRVSQAGLWLQLASQRQARGTPRDGARASGSRSRLGSSEGTLVAPGNPARWKEVLPEVLPVTQRDEAAVATMWRDSAVSFGHTAAGFTHVPAVWQLGG